MPFLPQRSGGGKGCFLAVLVCVAPAALGGSMNPEQRHEHERASSSGKARSLIVGFWGVRYQVKDVRQSVAFYTQTLGFNLDQQNLPAFAQVSIGNLKLILSGPGASGSRPMPDGSQQAPGGWNRVVLQVKDLSEQIAELKNGESIFATRWKSVPVGNRFRWKIPMAIRLSYWN